MLNYEVDKIFDDDSMIVSFNEDDAYDVQKDLVDAGYKIVSIGYVMDIGKMYVVKVQNDN